MAEKTTKAVEQLAECLEAYNQWEADLIMDQEAWSGGVADLPTLTWPLWDRLLEIQGMRNAALAAYRENHNG